MQRFYKLLHHSQFCFTWLLAMNCIDIFQAKILVTPKYQICYLNNIHREINSSGNISKTPFAWTTMTIFKIGGFWERSNPCWFYPCSDQQLLIQLELSYITRLRSFKKLSTKGKISIVQNCFITSNFKRSELSLLDSVQWSSKATSCFRCFSASAHQIRMKMWLRDFSRNWGHARSRRTTKTYRTVSPYNYDWIL